MDRLMVGAIVILVSCVTSLVHGDATGCDSSMPHTAHVTRRHDTCYQFVAEETSWRSARAYCYKYGGKLVKLDDPDTNTFVVDALNSIDRWRNNGVWIGLHDRIDELNWRWDAGDRAVDESMQWSNWDGGHPGAFLHSMRDCVRMVRGDNWRWHETPCNLLKWRYRFICQYEADDPTTGALPTPFGVAGWQNGRQRGQPSDEDFKLSSERKLNGDTSAPRMSTDKDELSWDFFADDITSFPLAAEQVAEHPQKVSSSGWMIGMGGVIIILLVALILVVFVRRKRQKKGAYSDTYSNPASSENPIYKADKGGGWLHDGGSHRPNDYVLDWRTSVSHGPDHFYEECKAAGARHACVIYANDDLKGKVSARSENDNQENEDVEKEGLLMKSGPETEPKSGCLYIPMNGSLSSLESADGSSRLLSRPPATDDGYQLPKPLDTDEYLKPEPSDEAGYEVPRTLPKVVYDVPSSVNATDTDADADAEDAEGQPIYETIDEVKRRI